jgi:hypothetical protein
MQLKAMNAMRKGKESEVMGTEKKFNSSKTIHHTHEKYEKNCVQRKFIAI